MAIPVPLAAGEEAAGGGYRYRSCLALPGVAPLAGCAAERTAEAWLAECMALHSPEAHAALRAHFLFSPGPSGRPRKKVEQPRPPPVATEAVIPVSREVIALGGAGIQAGPCCCSCLCCLHPCDGLSLLPESVERA